MTNAAKHAEAKTIWISIWDDEKGRLHLTVKDNGKGFDVEKGKKKRGHYGLLGIQERVRAINGQFNIKSTKLKGIYIRRMGCSQSHKSNMCVDRCVSCCDRPCSHLETKFF